MSSIQKDHEACIVRAYTRRKVARTELAHAEARAQEMGRGLAVLASRLTTPQPYIVQVEHGTLVFRTTGPTHVLVDHGDDVLPPYPALEQVAAVLNEITALREEITTLDNILA